MNNQIFQMNESILSKAMLMCLSAVVAMHWVPPQAQMVGGLQLHLLSLLAKMVV